MKSKNKGSLELVRQSEVNEKKKQVEQRCRELQLQRNTKAEKNSGEVANKVKSKKRGA